MPPPACPRTSPPTTANPPLLCSPSCGECSQDRTPNVLVIHLCLLSNLHVVGTLAGSADTGMARSRWSLVTWYSQSFKSMTGSQNQCACKSTAGSFNHWCVVTQGYIGAWIRIFPLGLGPQRGSINHWVLHQIIFKKLTLQPVQAYWEPCSTAPLLAGSGVQLTVSTEAMVGRFWAMGRLLHSCEHPHYLGAAHILCVGLTP